MVNSEHYIKLLLDSIYKTSQAFEKKYQLDMDYHAGSIFFGSNDNIAIYATAGWGCEQDELHEGDDITIPVDIIDINDKPLSRDVLEFKVSLNLNKDVDKYFEIMIPYLKNKGY